MDELQQDISALYDSIAVIEEVIKRNVHNEDYDDIVKRNYEHIEIMLAKPHISESGEDLSLFNECIQKAKAWLEE